MDKLKEYEPFGDEWEKEMMKFPKKMLIDLLRKNKSTRSENRIDLDKIVKKLEEVKLKELVDHKPIDKEKKNETRNNND